MGIGDRVRAEEERKAELAANAAGKPSGRQLTEVMGKGVAFADAMAMFALMENGNATYEQVLMLADMTIQQKEAASKGSDIALLTAQHRQDMEKLLERARNRRPESYLGDFPFPNISAFNPDGDAKPIPPLKCDIWEGHWDVKKASAVEGYQFELEVLTKQEARLLNLLQAGEYKVENFEGETGLVRVVATKNDATGEVVKLCIAYPHLWVDKASMGRKKPALLKLLTQILGYDGSLKHLNAWLDEQEKVAVAA